MNTVRLRLWVDPTSGDAYGTYPGDYGLNYTLPLAQELSAKGYTIYLDFHFSNYWADPSKQAIPPSWPTELVPLTETLRAYVSGTLEKFWEGGVRLGIVSLGNEIRHGLLWPTGVSTATSKLSREKRGLGLMSTFIVCRRRHTARQCSGAELHTAGDVVGGGETGR